MTLPYKPTIKLAVLNGIKINSLEKFIMLYEPDDPAEAVIFNEYLSSGLNTLNDQGRTQEQLLAVIEPEDDERLSCCCGAPENDYGLCTSCGEHTEFMTSAEMDAE